MSRLFLVPLLASVAASFCPAAELPSACTPDVNAKLAGLIASGTMHNVDNVMVCGVTTRHSRY